jgi:hypothetical protein
MRQLRPQVFIGPSVHPTDLHRLRRAGVTAVLSLQEPGADLPKTVIEHMRSVCEPSGVQFFNVGIPDYDPAALIASLPVVLVELDRLVRSGQVVYCNVSEVSVPFNVQSAWATTRCGCG